MFTETNFKDGNLTVSRVYSAPRSDVFDAWIETSKVKQWWGCADCTDVESEIEPKPGGSYNHHMTINTANGAHKQPGFATLTEYDPPTRLAYRGNDDGSDQMLVTVDFSDVEGGTLVRLVHSGIPDMKVMGDITMQQIIQGGWSDAFTKLTVFLHSDTAA